MNMYKYFTAKIVSVIVVWSISQITFAGNNEIDMQRAINTMHKFNTTSEKESMRRYLRKNYAIDIVANDESLMHIEAESPSLSDYELIVPRASQVKISKFERRLLTAYLDNPKDVYLAKYLAIHHLKRSLLFKPNGKGSALKHSILSQYFLNRVIDLDAGSRLIKKLLKLSEKRVNRLLASSPGVDMSENRKAHKFFIETFTKNESDRFVSYRKLLNDFVRNPNSVFSAFYINALNLWVGGETEADDPTILYNFVVGSYFSIYSMELTKRAENAWLEDPDNNIRFRLGNIIGGFSILQRRWIAELHGDTDAIANLDDEHREWGEVNVPFHTFSLGVSFFSEEELFLEGYLTWAKAFSSCQERPDIRTCPNRPRFSFNQLLMVLGFVDYNLKLGDLDTARAFLNARFDPAQRFEDWDLGKDAWFQRENNLEAIAALYANDDPKDDPEFAVSRSHNWSASTSTCQVCHQQQSRVWSEEEQNTIILSPDDVLTIGDFPAISTKWYGGSFTN